MILQVVLVINYCLSTPNSSFWSDLKMDLGPQIFFLSQLCHMKFCQEKALERLAREGRRSALLPGVRAQRRLLQHRTVASQRAGPAAKAVLPEPGSHKCREVSRTSSLPSISFWQLSVEVPLVRHLSNFQEVHFW